MTRVEQPSATFRPAALLGGAFSPRAGHLPFASDLVAALKPSLIVQLGVASGDSYLGLCQLVAENSLKCSVYGIEPLGKTNGSKPHAPAFDAVSRQNEARYQAFSHLVRKSFEEAAEQFEAGSIQLLDVDGLQSYDALKRTFELWLEKVHPAGVILLHNIALRAGDSGAARLWNELKAALPHFAFRHGNGLGIIAKSFGDAAEIPYVAELFTAQPEERNLIRRYYAACSERLELLSRPAPASGVEAAQSLFRVFRSRDNQYSAIPELTHSASPGVWINLRIDLPDGTGDRPLRLDVASKPAIVDIATLALRKEDGHTVWNWNPKGASEQLAVEGTASRLPEPEFFRVLALSPSAKVFLPHLSGPDFEQPLELEIRFRVDLELKALKDLTQQQPAQSSSASPAAVEAAVAKAKADSAKYLAQSRIEYDAKIRQLSADAEARIEATRSELDSLRSEMEVLKSRHQQDMAGQAALLEEERAHHQVTRLEKETLLAQQQLMLQEISIAQGNVEELKAEVERLSGELATSEFDLSELRKLNARMAAALEEERAVRIQMQESGSWQITKPIRAVTDLFGPRRKF
jgi:predicted DNA-binding protein (UPF0251 family)